MLNEYDHANKLRQSCENMKKCRDAAMAVKKRRLAKQEFGMDQDDPVQASTPAAPSANLQGQHKAGSGGPTL